MKLFETREAAQILDLPEARIRSCVRAGFLCPRRGPGRKFQFTFQDLLVLKTTKGLLDSGVPATRISRMLGSLRRQLAEDMHLSSLTIYADGRRVVVWDGNACWEPDSGQFLFNFDVRDVVQQAATPDVLGLTVISGERALSRVDVIEIAPVLSRARTIDAPRRVRAVAAAALASSNPDLAAPREAQETHPAATPIELLPKSREGQGLTADQWFDLACELEQESREEARQAYHRALELDPDHADAHLNLGRYYHEANELGKAEVHYRSAVQHAPEDATSHFNLGVLLEDLKRPSEAIYAYKQAIARDPELADAHYNLGLVLETLGKRSEAIQHLMLARKLYGKNGEE